MKSRSLFSLAVAALAIFALRPTAARAEVSFEFFYESLAPHGEWIEVGDYGSCWRPHGVDADWSPYSDGYWSYTDGGWTWVSYEEFGGIVYHYGRWVQVEDEGWCWVPDDEWAPAWVSWRSNDDYVGWAPLPPEARWRRDTGISVWVDHQYDIGPSRFNFCRVSDFGAPYLRPVICNRRENVTIILGTANVTNISYYDGGGYGGLVHCGGPSFVTVNRYVHRPIPTFKLVKNTNITNINIKQVNVFNSVQRGNQLTVLAPRIKPRTAEMVRPTAVRTVAAAKVTKGWDGVKDPEAVNNIRTKLRQESRGLTPDTAPARRVQAADLKMVPVKADPNAPSPIRNAKTRVAPASKPVTGADKPIESKPIDPRTAEKQGRDKARMTTEGSPATRTAPVVAEPKKKDDQDAPRTVISRTPETNPAGNGKTRTAPRTIAPANVPPPSTEPRTVTTPIERAPTVKSKGKSEEDAKARSAAAARERAIAEQSQKDRSAAIERQRNAQESMKKQPVQPDAAAEARRRQQASESARMKVNDDARKQEAAQAARSRQVESTRKLQVDNARKEQASQVARQQQMESARREQAVQSARKQQSDAARSQQIESARRQQAMESARQQQIQRQPVVRQQPPPQVQRQAPVVRQQPPPQVQRQAPAPAAGKRQLSSEELEARKKKKDD